MARFAWLLRSACSLRRWCAPAICVVLLVVGCTSTPKPSVTPETTNSPPKPPLFGLLTSTDPHAARVDVRALPCGNAVRGHCVLIATVVDDQGKPMRGKRIEWTLEGVGHILAADDRAGLLTSRGKLEKQYAVTETGRSTTRVAQNTGRPADDIVLDVGETWCTITSATEGESHLTVYAPDVANMANNRAIVTQRWIDTSCTLPLPSAGRPGDRVPLVTRVFRQADNQPLPGYWVRYRYLDGPPALLLPTGSTEALVITDAGGLGSSAVYQASPQAGKTRLSVEVLRPDPRTPTAQPVVVYHGETSVEWQAPAVALAHTGPITVPVGQKATFGVAVRNNSAAATPAYTVRVALPDGAVLNGTDPPAIHEGNTLVWTLAELAGGATRNVQFSLTSSRIGALTSRASVVTAEGLHDEQAVTADVVPPAAPKLEAAVSIPTVALLTQGVNGAASLPVPCTVTVRNPGTGPAANVTMRAIFLSNVLQLSSPGNPDSIAIGTLKPGETRTVSLSLLPKAAGETPFSVELKADGGLTAKAFSTGTLKVVEAGVVLKLAGPAQRIVGRPADWTVEVKNTGQVPLQQVVVRDLLPAELQFAAAPDGRPNGNEVLWDVGVLRPGEGRVLKLTTTAMRPAPKAVNSAFVTAQAMTETLKPGAAVPLPLGLLQSKAEATLAIEGAAALALKVADKVDPIHVGDATGYTIQVTNRGSLDGEKVQVVCQIPAGMRVTAVWGPGAYRMIGERLEFQPVDRLAPGASLSYGIDVQATKNGDMRFRAELSSTALQQPLVKEESTLVR